MKVRASVRRICENCKIVRRKGVVRVICTQHEAQAEARLRAVASCRVAELRVKRRPRDSQLDTRNSDTATSEHTMPRISGIDIPAGQEDQDQPALHLRRRADQRDGDPQGSRHRPGASRQGPDRRRAGEDHRRSSTAASSSKVPSAGRSSRTSAASATSAATAATVTAAACPSAASAPGPTPAPARARARRSPARRA